MRSRSTTGTYLALGVSVLGVLLVATLVGVSLGARNDAVQVSAPRSNPAGAPAKMVLVDPVGEFAYYIDGIETAVNTYRLGETGKYIGETRVRQSGADYRYLLEAERTNAGTWMTAAARTPDGDNLEYSWDGHAIRRTRDGPAKVYYPASRLPLLDEWQPVLFESLIAAYLDKGVTECLYIPLGVIGVEITPPSKVSELAGVERAGYRKLDTLYRTRVNFVGHFAANIWYDGDQRVILIVFPSEHSAFIRAGYEDLMDWEGAHDG